MLIKKSYLLQFGNVPTDIFSTALADMETSKLQDHPSLSRNRLADKIIRSKTQISPPNHPITSHQFQSLGTCQESETQLAHYMSFSSGCPPRALIFVRTPECHDTPEISAITI